VIVECSNCGAGPEAWAALILAALSFLAAIAAVRYAKQAADIANKSVALAREEMALAREEHDVFLRELRARARFQFSLRIDKPERYTDEIWMDHELPEPGSPGSEVPVIVRVELRNVGDRMASETVIKLIAPRELALGLRCADPTARSFPSPHTRSTLAKSCPTTKGWCGRASTSRRHFRP
jgi:hypothetical protein